MFERITGNLIVREPNRAVLDVNGVGYLFTIPLSTFDRLPPLGSSSTLLCWLQVREDVLGLFGFSTEDEREWFLRLTQLPGVGPKLAINILSGIRLGDLRQALMQGDVKRLKSISGVGEKLAQRMAVELRTAVAGSAPVLPGTVKAEAAGVFQDAVMALEALGIARPTAEKNAARVLIEHPNATVSEVIQRALSNG
jgi:holliday junction DNA helicase RuvA